MSRIDLARQKLNDANTDLIFACNLAEKLVAEVALAEAKVELAELLLNSSDFEKPKTVSYQHVDSKTWSSEYAATHIAKQNAQLEKAVAAQHAEEKFEKSELKLSPCDVQLALESGASPFSVRPLSKPSTVTGQQVNFLLQQHAELVLEDFRFRVSGVLPHLRALRNKYIEPGLKILEQIENGEMTVEGMRSLRIEAVALDLFIDKTYELSDRTRWTPVIRFVETLRQHIAQDNFAQCTPKLVGGACRITEQRGIWEACQANFPQKGASLNEIRGHQQAAMASQWRKRSSGGSAGSAQSSTSTVSFGVPLSVMAPPR
ncbi:MAG: hypothetical protein P1U63_00980 [Coxiellaceae bacterium]|nr:hypothetical protein [Coxiellaceae bacterium]